MTVLSVLSIANINGDTTYQHHHFPLARKFARHIPIFHSQYSWGFVTPHLCQMRWKRVTRLIRRRMSREGNNILEQSRTQNMQQFAVNQVLCGLYKLRFHVLSILSRKTGTRQNSIKLRRNAKTANTPISGISQKGIHRA